MWCNTKKKVKTVFTYAWVDDMNSRYSKWLYTCKETTQVLGYVLKNWNKTYYASVGAQGYGEFLELEGAKRKVEVAYQALQDMLTE